MLAASIHDGYHACVALLETGGESQIDILARGVFEAHVNFVNVLTSESYTKTFQRCSAIEAGKLLQNYLNLKSEVQDEEVVKLALSNRDHMDRIAAKLASDSAGDRLPQHRFEHPELPAGTYALYRKLCGPTHGNLNSLFERFQRGEKILLGGVLPDWRLADALLIASMCAIGVIQRVPQFADIDEDALRKERSSADEAIQTIAANQESASEDLVRAVDSVA